MSFKPFKPCICGAKQVTIFVVMGQTRNVSHQLCRIYSAWNGVYQAYITQGQFQFHFPCLDSITMWIAVFSPTPLHHHFHSSKRAAPTPPSVPSPPPLHRLFTPFKRQGMLTTVSLGPCICCKKLDSKFFTRNAQTNICACLVVDPYICFTTMDWGESEEHEEVVSASIK